MDIGYEWKFSRILMEIFMDIITDIFMDIKPPLPGRVSWTGFGASLTHRGSISEDFTILVLTEAAGSACSALAWRCRFDVLEVEGINGILWWFHGISWDFMALVNTKKSEVEFVNDMAPPFGSIFVDVTWCLHGWAVAAKPLLVDDSLGDKKKLYP